MRVLISGRWLVLISLISISAAQQGAAQSAAPSAVGAGQIAWQPDADVETFWREYAGSKGGLTWGPSDVYPEYSRVEEGDTLMIQLEQGVCLMEFFHNRWRRANDVRRWHDSINEYGACPYVFD